MTEKGNLPFQIPDDKVADYFTLKENNRSLYGKLIINAAELWGANMEKEMAQGVSLETAAASTERRSVSGEFTGSMYGFVTGVLCQFWEHGDDFGNWIEHRYNNSKVDYTSPDECEDLSPTMQM